MKTIELDDRLFAEAQELAAQTGQTVTWVVENAVRESLAKQHTDSAKPVYPFPTCGGRGVRPGVNLESNAELLDLMEKGDVPR